MARSGARPVRDALLALKKTTPDRIARLEGF